MKEQKSQSIVQDLIETIGFGKNMIQQRNILFQQTLREVMEETFQHFT